MGINIRAYPPTSIHILYVRLFEARVLISLWCLSLGCGSIGNWSRELRKTATEDTLFSNLLARHIVKWSILFDV